MSADFLTNLALRAIDGGDTVRAAHVAPVGPPTGDVGGEAAWLADAPPASDDRPPTPSVGGAAGAASQLAPGRPDVRPQLPGELPAIRPLAGLARREGRTLPSGDPQPARQRTEPGDSQLPTAPPPATERSFVDDTTAMPRGPAAPGEARRPDRPSQGATRLARDPLPSGGPQPARQRTVLGDSQLPTASPPATERSFVDGMSLLQATAPQPSPTDPMHPLSVAPGERARRTPEPPTSEQAGPDLHDSAASAAFGRQSAPPPLRPTPPGDLSQPDQSPAQQTRRASTELSSQAIALRRGAPEGLPNVPTVVRVSIGRVELRAAAPPPARPAPTPRPKPAMGLDDFLSKQDERRR
jgi:hypothetical protein